MDRSRLKAVVTNWVQPEVLELLSGRCTVEANREREPWPPSEVLARTRDADALLCFMTDRIDEAFLAQCPRLRIVACALKGADNFDIEACRRRGVTVTIVPDLLTEPTAELAVGLMIALARHIRHGDAHVRSGTFTGWRPTLYGRGLSGSKVGILGLGAVGQALARRLHAFGAALAYFDERPLSDSAERALGVVRRDRESVIGDSDFLMLALPLTPRTLHLIDAAQIRRMKPGTFLVNPARGSLVDEEAVTDALESGHLAGYAADVFEMEDWARGDRPRRIAPRLLRHPATVLTPHLGSAVEAVRREIALSAARDIIACLTGGRPPNAIN